MKMNRERLTGFFNSHGIHGFTLTKIRFPQGRATTARIHCDNLGISCYLQVLSCLKKSAWSFTDSNNKEHSGSAVVAVDSEQDLSLNYNNNKSDLFEETLFFQTVFKTAELARMIVEFLSPTDQVNFYFDVHKHNSTIGTFNKLCLDMSWPLFTGPHALREFQSTV